MILQQSLQELLQKSLKKYQECILKFLWQLFTPRIYAGIRTINYPVYKNTSISSYNSPSSSSFSNFPWNFYRILYRSLYRSPYNSFYKKKLPGTSTGPGIILGVLTEIVLEASIRIPFRNYSSNSSRSFCTNFNRSLYGNFSKNNYSNLSKNSTDIFPEARNPSRSSYIDSCMR